MDEGGCATDSDRGTSCGTDSGSPTARRSLKHLVCQAAHKLSFLYLKIGIEKIGESDGLAAERAEMERYGMPRAQKK